MATRIKSIFITFPEFAEWLRETTEQLGARVILERIAPRAPLEYWDGSDKMLTSAFRAWLTIGEPDLATIPSNDLTPGKLGWMDLPVPKMENGCLRMIQIGAKSDWYDSATGRVFESPISLRLFDRFWRRWKKRFTYGVWAKNRVTAGEAFYSDIGCSAGAAEWFRRGGRLSEEDGSNIEYSIRDPPL
jgi:hypothetical protein